MNDRANTSLVLRCCNADMTSRNGFIWPGVGEIATARDWIANDKCGNGLHGWLYGSGCYSTCEYVLNKYAKWLVVQVLDTDIKELVGKCKFRSGTVVFVGEMTEAAEYILKNEPKANPSTIIGLQVFGIKSALVGSLGTAIVGNSGTATAGDHGVATTGEGGTATAGDYGTAIAGYKGTATAGYKGTAIAGEGGTATAGNSGTAAAGDGGTATTGNYGTATTGEGGTTAAGDHGKATAGYKGTATAGYKGTAIAGEGGTATAGANGTAAAGNGGIICLTSYDNTDRHRLIIGYINEGGLEANVIYKLDINHKFIKVG